MCERAREWASLRLDGELSELEGALLDAHTRRCAACAEYVVEAGAITAAIRTAEPEELSHPVALPLRRRVAWPGRALQAGAATAAVCAATVGLAVQLGSSTSSHGLVRRMPASEISSGPNSESDALLRLPRLVNLKSQYGVVRQRGLRIDT